MNTITRYRVNSDMTIGKHIVLMGSTIYIENPIESLLKEFPSTADNPTLSIFISNGKEELPADYISPSDLSRCIENKYICPQDALGYMGLTHQEMKYINKYLVFHSSETSAEEVNISRSIRAKLNYMFNKPQFLLR